jgi:SAM-dependent methyltransferase
MNEAQIEHWNGAEAYRWVELQDRYDRQLAPFADAILDAAAVTRHERVLDVGCGCGTTTLRAARTSAHAIGIDISGPMLERAGETAAQAGITNVEFVQADVQTHAFAAPFDVAISRFGMMFFEDPKAALTNIGRALQPGGRLAFVCWQELARNDWLYLPGLAAAQYLPPPAAIAGGGPGPFSLADRDALRTLLESAGFSNIAIDSYEVLMLLGGGGTLEESLTFLLNTGAARAMFEGAPPSAAEHAIAAARHVLADHYDDDGVRLGAATWIVTARRAR